MAPGNDPHAKDLYLIPGDPVTNVRLPAMFNAAFDRCGFGARMVALQVRARDFAVWLKASFLARNVRGMVIAPPHKPLAVDLLHGVGVVARVAGSVNVIQRTGNDELEGDLFDGEGIVGALDHFGMPYRGRRVLILGAGVSAAAIGVSLAEGAPQGEGAAEIAFFDPASGKSAGVAARIGSALGAQVHAVDQADPRGYDLVINATPVGLAQGDPLPCDVARLEPHAAVFDILLRNQPTPLVRAARARGLHAQPGFEMLIQQMPHYFDYFGLPEAAALVRHDSAFLRELIYPPALAEEIRQAPRHAGTAQR